MASIIYNVWKGEIMRGNIDLDTAGDTIQVQLHTSTYVPDVDHVIGSLTNEVAAGGGYSTGGATLGSQTVTIDNTNDVGFFDGANTTWTTSTITARYAVLIDTTPVTDVLIACIDFVTDKSSSGGDFTIQWDATGIVEIA